MEITRKMKYLTLVTTIAIGLSLVPSSAQAETLGWDENEGYTVTNENNLKLMERASANVPKHTASVIAVGKPTSNVDKIHATTTGTTSLHYTRARFERGKTAFADTGRKWGTQPGYSTATTAPFLRDFTFTTARSYWGF